jgi:antitoxin ParD1/3/4
VRAKAVRALFLMTMLDNGMGFCRLTFGCRSQVRDIILSEPDKMTKLLATGGLGMANDGRNVSLTDRHRRFIDNQVESGRHASASEVVREALRRYEGDVLAETAAIDALFAVAARSEAGEATGDFVDIRDRAHLTEVVGGIAEDVIARSRRRRSA